MESSQTLLLNQGFEPIKVISWQRAITLLFLGKVEVLEEYEASGIRSVNLVIKIPAVVRLLRAFRRHARPVKFSRVNIYARDNYKCQYCGRKASISELTYDHVMPRSRGGMTEWTNIVTCCYLCNRKKGGRTPNEAGMKLLASPIAAELGARGRDPDLAALGARRVARLPVLDRRARQGRQSPS